LNTATHALRPLMRIDMKSSSYVRQPRPLVVCIHSSGASARQWEPLADRLGNSCNVLAPNLFGHATEPEWTGEPRKILAADVERVVHVLAGRAAHLVGHSYGGVVALQIALRYPDRVNSVTVYEPVMFRLLRDFAPHSNGVALAAGIAAGIRRDLEAGLAGMAARRFVDYWSGSGTFAALPELQRQSIARRMPMIAAHFAALWNDETTLERFAGLRMPVTLMIGGRTHSATRRIVELLRSVIPHAHYQAMSAMGHTGPMTHPYTVAQRLAVEVRLHARREAAALRVLAA
jgi:pimeloyl-ACP methyl ester carboxylesterase